MNKFNFQLCYTSLTQLGTFGINCTICYVINYISLVETQIPWMNINELTLFEKHVRYSTIESELFAHSNHHQKSADYR